MNKSDFSFLLKSPLQHFCGPQKRRAALCMHLPPAGTTCARAGSAEGQQNRIELIDVSPERFGTGLPSLQTLLSSHNRLVGIAPMQCTLRSLAALPSLELAARSSWAVDRIGQVLLQLEIPVEVNRRVAKTRRGS